MKKRISALLLAIIFTVVTIFGLVAINFDNIRWDKIPSLLLRFEILEGLNKSSIVDGSFLSEPLRWDQIDQIPEDLPDGEPWFYLNSHTKNLLKNYMKENNLGIIPDYWPLQTRSDFEDCLEVFRFVELEEKYRTDTAKPVVAQILVAVSSSFAVFFWIIHLYGKRNQMPICENINDEIKNSNTKHGKKLLRSLKMKNALIIVKNLLQYNILPISIIIMLEDYNFINLPLLEVNLRYPITFSLNLLFIILFLLVSFSLKRIHSKLKSTDAIS